jgi:hypothetical protein
LVGASPIVGLQTTVTAGVVTVANQPVTIACPGPQTVHWGDVVQFDVTATDGDLANGCENLTFAFVGTGNPPTATIAKTGPTTAHVTWATGGADVCTHTITVGVTDKCGLTAECATSICVQNTPPVITDTLTNFHTVWGTLLTGMVGANDPDGGPYAKQYSLVSFDGPTSYGSGFHINASTGVWTWDVAPNTQQNYLGDFNLCLKVSDGANVCSPCSPTNADTMCYKIHVDGFLVKIKKIESVYQGHHAIDTISIINGSSYLGGFDFLVAYDASALTLVNVTKGQAIDVGGAAFEYFTYRFGADGNCGNGCPSGLVRIVGIRDYNDGIKNTHMVVNSGDMAYLDFLISNDRNLGCQYAPVRFFWLDCGDNVLTDTSGNWSYLGQQVLEFTGVEVPRDSMNLSYGFVGPADTCYDTVYATGGQHAFKNAPLGAVIFQNGGFDIICPKDIDDRGDINLNGIKNEIGDAVVFTNYFINGLGAFTINVEGQTAATEVNGDGIVLSVADLVYLIRVIVGDALPLPKTNPDAMAKFYANGQTVQVETPVEIGAALLVFNGEIYPALSDAASGMEIKYGYSNGVTRVLVYSFSRRAITSGDILTLSGHGSLVSVEAADNFGAILATNKSFQLPTEFALSQNYPNPFNPTTTIELALPTASNWTLTVYNVNGQKVTEFSGHSEAGVVPITWDASNIPSGIYFYKVQAGNFSATKKMVLLK